MRELFFNQIFNPTSSQPIILKQIVQNLTSASLEQTEPEFSQTLYVANLVFLANDWSRNVPAFSVIDNKTPSR